MRFRSLVVSWCVCAIHGSVQIASGHRSLDATSRSTYHPRGDIETSLVHFLRNIPQLPSSTPSLPVSQPRSPSRYAVEAIPQPVGIDEKTERRRSLTKRATAVRKKIVELPAKRGSRRKRRKKCSCRKGDARRKIDLSKLEDTTPTESNESSLPSTVRSLFTSVSTTNIPTSTPNPTTVSSTTPWRFTDIASTTDVVTSTINAMTITKARKIMTKEADDANRETYRQNYPRRKCKKIKCATKNCKRRRKKKKNVIILDREFRNKRGNVRASRMETSPSSLENVNLYPIMD